MFIPSLKLTSSGSIIYSSDHRNTVTAFKFLHTFRKWLCVLCRTCGHPHTLESSVSHVLKLYFDQTKEDLGGIEEEISALRNDLKATSGKVHYLDTSLDDLTASVEQLHDSVQELKTGRNLAHIKHSNIVFSKQEPNHASVNITVAWVSLKKAM